MMRNTWYELIREELKLNWLTDSEQAVPFTLGGIPREEWQADRFEKAGEAQWVLRAHHPAGLEASWHLRLFRDTRAVEMWGEVTHCGQLPTALVTNALTFALSLPMKTEFGQPWVRSINGVKLGSLANVFPPHDFAVVDRQLIDTPQTYTPLQLQNEEGGRSSANTIPCLILAGEKQQEGFAVFLEWSGLWEMGLWQSGRQVGDPGATRPTSFWAGLRGLRLNLKPGQTLPLPRVLLTAFTGDLEAGGNALRRHIRRHVTPKLGGQEILPPTSFNHWFAFENQFTADLLKPAVEASAAAGLEYFCVDGGWFTSPQRDGVWSVHDWRKGIGNWSEGDPRKFPGGIKPLADFVRAQGMNYGTWFEPEWAHCDSEMCRHHPEWFIPSPPSAEYHLRNFGLPAVRDWWVQRFQQAYAEWGMRWVRWDFNQAPQPDWDEGVPEGEIGWRQIEHITGLYRTLDEIMDACPELLIEQCAGGGHRIDLGTVRRGHSFWMNDHTTQTDLVRFFQHGLNTILPGNYPNTNLCQKRHDFTDYDFLSHSAGGFGYSGRLHEAPKEDFIRYRDAVARFKQFRHHLLEDYHRPTGCPRRADEYARVLFGDFEMEFNLPGQPRSARCGRLGKPDEEE